MEISLLATHPEFAEQLAPAIWQHWRKELPEDFTVQHRIAKLRAHMNRDTLPMAWVAHQNGVPLGTASIRTHDLDDRKDLSPWLGGVFVLPSQRGLGVASALCQAARAHAWSVGIESLYLFTPDQERLYQKMGWQNIATANWRGLCGTIMVSHRASA